MPNHVYSVISLPTLTEKQKGILKKIEEAEGLCRYYKPMPKELENTTAPKDKPNWYGWCNEHWGTKWGCYDFVVEDEVIRFTSAWSPIGENIIDMFTEDFPSFTYNWEEEQEYGAEMEYDNGECIDRNEYDMPDWIEVKELDDGSTITKLINEHPNYEDGIGYYLDWSKEFLGKEIGEMRRNLEEGAVKYPTE
jgi:hypothetical protein